MYRIISGSETVGDFEYPVFVRLSGNGCYVPCDRDIAEGVCVKRPKKQDIEVEGGGTETITVVEDTVFRFGETGLRGDEPICTISVVEEEEA